MKPLNWLPYVTQNKGEKKNINLVNLFFWTWGRLKKEKVFPIIDTSGRSCHLLRYRHTLCVPLCVLFPQIPSAVIYLSYLTKEKSCASPQDLNWSRKPYVLLWASRTSTSPPSDDSIFAASHISSWATNRRWFGSPRDSPYFTRILDRRNCGACPDIPNFDAFIRRSVLFFFVLIWWWISCIHVWW